MSTYSDVGSFADEEDYDFEDVDCADCGMKFFIRHSLYTEEAQALRENAGMPRREFPRICQRCAKGLAPLYEY